MAIIERIQKDLVPLKIWRDHTTNSKLCIEKKTGKEAGATDRVHWSARKSLLYYWALIESKFRTIKLSSSLWITDWGEVAISKFYPFTLLQGEINSISSIGKEARLSRVYVI